MATLLDRSLMPGGGVGLTSGVNYFGDVGQRQTTSLLRPPDNISPSAPTLPAVETQATDTGWRVNPPEPGFIGYGSYGGAGEGRTGEGAPATSGSMSASDAATLGMIGTGIGTLGMMSQDPGLGMMGNTMSGVAAASQGQFGPIGATVGGMFGGPTGAALGSIAGQSVSQGGPTAAGIAGTLGGAMFGAPGYALGSIGGQVASGTATPSSIGSTLGYAMLGPTLGPAAGPVGSAIAGGLFGMNDTMSPMGVPTQGYQGLFGTDMGYQLGLEAFANPSTPAGIGTSGGMGFGISGGQGLNAGSTLGLSAPSSSIGSGIGSSASASGSGFGGMSFGGDGISGGGLSSSGIGTGSSGGGISMGGGGLGLSAPSDFGGFGGGDSGGFGGGFGDSGPSGSSGAGGASAAGPGESDGGGGGGGGGGGKIICTAMNHAYGFGSFRNAIWIAYADKHLTKAHEVGYHTLFLPLVDFGFKRGDGKLNLLVRRVLEWGTRHRSTDLRAEMRGTKRDTTGRIIRFIFEPLCYVVGRIKGAR
jgi:hypothetical protein